MTTQREYYFKGDVCHKNDTLMKVILKIGSNTTVVT